MTIDGAGNGAPRAGEADFAAADREFLRLQFATGASQGFFSVDTHLITPGRFLYGGACIGASVASLEAAYGTTVMWLTTQFITNAVDPERVTIDVERLAGGRSISQVAARGSVDGTVLFASTAVMSGVDPSTVDSLQFELMPAVPRPEEVAPHEHRMRRVPRPDFSLDESYWGLVDIRGPVPLPDPADPARVVVWARVPGRVSSTPTMLAYLADVVPFGLGAVAGQGGLSMDNTVRYVQDRQSEWVLLDIHVHGLARSMGTGTVHCFAPDGALLAVASQTVRIMHHIPELQETPPAPEG